MNAMGRLRRRLQWPRPILIGIDAAAIVLAVAAIWTFIERPGNNASFIASQALFTAALFTLAVSLALTFVRLARTRLDLVMIPVLFLLFAFTALVGWALCWEASLGGHPCWWEAFDL
jgi:hypothetical protein